MYRMTFNSESNKKNPAAESGTNIYDEVLVGAS